MPKSFRNKSTTEAKSAHWSEMVYFHGKKAQTGDMESEKTTKTAKNVSMGLKEADFGKYPGKTAEKQRIRAEWEAEFSPPTRLRREKISIGDRVILPKDSRFIAGERYPVEGSKWECEGTVIGTHHDHNIVKVRWDNGFILDVNAKDFKVVNKQVKEDKPDPNQAFRRKKNEDEGTHDFDYGDPWHGLGMWDTDSRLDPPEDEYIEVTTMGSAEVEYIKGPPMLDEDYDIEDIFENPDGN